MDAQYFTQLKEQRSAIEGFLQVQRDGIAEHDRPGVRITAQIYIIFLKMH